MKLTTQQFVSGSSVAQAVIGSFIPGVRIDGKWGAFTQKGFDRLTESQQADVSKAIAAVVPGSRPIDFVTFRNAQKLEGARTSIRSPAGSSDIRALIRSIALEEGVPPDAAIKFAMLESGLNPAAYNASGATGLFQIMKGALADVNKIYGVKNGKQFTMSDMRDAAKCTRVGVQYMKIAARYANVPVTDVATVYMAYNIGAGNLAKLKAGKYDDKEAKVAVENQAASYGKNTRTYIANVSKIVDNLQVA